MVTSVIELCHHVCDDARGRRVRGWCWVHHELFGFIYCKVKALAHTWCSVLVHDQSQFILFSRLNALFRVRTTANDLYVSVEGVVDVSMWLSRVSGRHVSRLKAFPGLLERGLPIARRAP